MSSENADVVTSTHAKAHLNALLADVKRTGRVITITSHGKAVAKLSPIADPPPRTFGFMPDLPDIGPNFDEPLTDDELAAWEWDL
jgi:prevent-host-death family protein